MGSRVGASMLLSTYVRVDAEGVNGFGSITCRDLLLGSSRMNTIKRDRSYHLEISYNCKLCSIARCEIFHSWYRRRVQTMSLLWLALRLQLWAEVWVAI